MENQNQEKVCCPKFDPIPWDGKIVEWSNKRFIKDRVYSLFYMPLNFGSVMGRVFKATEAAGAKIEDGMWLSDHTSMWKMDLYTAVDKDVPGLENVTLSGKFLCKVYEGPFKEAGKWYEEFLAYAKGRGMDAKKVYFWHTTCPVCAKKYGKNYVVILGQVA